MHLYLLRCVTDTKIEIIFRVVISACCVMIYDTYKYICTRSHVVDMCMTIRMMYIHDSYTVNAINELCCSLKIRLIRGAKNERSPCNA